MAVEILQFIHPWYEDEEFERVMEVMLEISWHMDTWEAGATD